jgi:hypothetical protein
MGGQQLRLGDSEHHLRVRKTSVLRRWASVCRLGDTGSVNLATGPSGVSPSDRQRATSIVAAGDAPDQGSSRTRFSPPSGTNNLRLLHPKGAIGIDRPDATISRAPRATVRDRARGTAAGSAR